MSITVTCMPAACSAFARWKPMKPAPPVTSTLELLVTGGAGFIGFHLAKALHAAGMHVTVIDNMDPYYSAALKQARWDMLTDLDGVNMVEGDMCNDTLLNELQQKHVFTHVASLAGQAGERSHARAQKTDAGDFRICRC